MAPIAFIAGASAGRIGAHRLTDNFSGGPGESLREAIDELHLDATAHIFMAILLPILAFSIYLSVLQYGRKRITPSMPLFALLGVGAFVYGLMRFLILRRAIDTLREGLDAEIAVSQELNELLRDGFRVASE